MLKRFLILAAVALVAGCAALTDGSLGTGDPVALQKGLLTACRGANTAERTLIKFIDADKVPATAFPDIREAQRVVRQFCGSGAPMPANLLDATLQVGAAATALLAAKP